MSGSADFLVGSALAISVSAALFTGCVQYPTERQGVVDQRPQISFRLDPADLIRLGDARVMVDGLDAGRLGDFVDGAGALRVLPGTHTIRVVSGTLVLLDERTYLGDGIARAFTVK